MNSIKSITFIVGLCFLASCSEENRKIHGTWRMYESSSTFQTVSYDSTLCPIFDLYASDPLEYRFDEWNHLYYVNLGGACPIYSEVNYEIKNSKLFIRSGNSVTELNVLRLDDTELHLQRSLAELNTVDKFKRVD